MEEETTTGTGIRVIAIDWSGEAQGGAKKIWLAEVVDGSLVRLENGRKQDAVVTHLVDHAKYHPEVVIGLDFAFSLPAWYLRERGWANVRELWAGADRDANDWLAACEWPLWGKPGKGKPTWAASLISAGPSSPSRSAAGSAQSRSFRWAEPAPSGPAPYETCVSSTA